MNITKKPFNISLAEIVLLTTFLPYLKQCIPISVGYAISAGVVLLFCSILLTFPSIFAYVLKVSRKSTHFWIFLLFLLISQFISTLTGSITLHGFIKTIGYLMIGICGYIIFPALFASGKDRFLWTFLSKVGAFFSIIAIAIVVVGKVRIFGVQFTSSWVIPIFGGIHSSSSVFFDENYFAVVAFIGFITSFCIFKESQLKSEKIIFATLSILNLLGILLSYSRATYVATLFAILVYFLIQKKLSQKILFIMSYIIVGLVILFLILNTYPLYRFMQVNRGLTGRGLLWRAALEAILKRPFLGWGVGNVAYVIHREGLVKWASSHNSFLDFILMVGIPTGLSYIGVIIISLGRLWASSVGGLRRRILSTSILGMIILMQFTTHTLGGISFGSFIFTVLLGIANTSSETKIQYYYKNRAK